MKFQELKPGDLFRAAGNPKVYLKIEPIYDQWGNVLVAVDRSGIPVERYDGFLEEYMTKADVFPTGEEI